jgi:hypothetical protein
LLVRQRIAATGEQLFTFVAMVLCGYIIYATGFDPAFGSFPALTIILLLVVGVCADAVWFRRPH